MILQMQHFLDDPGEVFVFQEMDLFCQGFRRVARLHHDPGLEDRRPVIVMFVDKMNGYPRFLFRSREYRLVNEVAIHPFPAEFWQEGRVDVHNPARIRPDQRHRDLP